VTATLPLVQGTDTDFAICYAKWHKGGIKIRSDISRKYQDRGQGRVHRCHTCSVKRLR